MGVAGCSSRTHSGTTQLRGVSALRTAPTLNLSFVSRHTMINPLVKLVPVTMQHKLALTSSKAKLQEMLGVEIPDHWPQFPEAFEVRAEDTGASELWPSYFFVCPSESVLVGNGGFAAPPNNAGEVEIGYEIAPAYQNKGYGTAAAGALSELAFSRPTVNAIVAHTLAQENASNAVLRKIGMSMVAELPNPEVGKVWKWSVRRAT
ncbi:MAG: N-acetyltransferase [Comamonadaceae bacterium]|nr:MAG: N-acetyltransferase [Comamonadaceae bacterium]